MEVCLSHSGLKNDRLHHRSGVILLGLWSRNLSVTVRSPSWGHVLPCENRYTVHVPSDSDLLLGFRRRGRECLFQFNLLSLAWNVLGSKCSYSADSGIRIGQQGASGGLAFMGAAVSLHIRHKQTNKNLVRRLFFYSQEHLINLRLVSDFFL